MNSDYLKLFGFTRGLVMAEYKNLHERQVAYFYRGAKKDRYVEIILRILCAIIAIATVACVILFFVNGGIDYWKQHETPRFQTYTAIGLVGGILTLTISYAIKGDKSPLLRKCIKR